MRAGFLGALALLAGGYTVLAFRLDPFGPAGSPGPGFLPRVLGIGLLLALLPDVRGLWTRRAGRATEPGGGASDGDGASTAGHFPHDRIAVAIGVLAVLLAASLPVLGTVPACMLFLLVSLTLLNPGARVLNGVLSLAVPLALHLIFALWLDVQLPEGVLGPRL